MSLWINWPPQTGSRAETEVSSRSSKVHNGAHESHDGGCQIILINKLGWKTKM